MHLEINKMHDARIMSRCILKNEKVGEKFTWLTANTVNFLLKRGSVAKVKIQI